MIWMMPDALLARQLRVSGALASRHSQGGPQHAGVDDGITAPRGMGAPLRPHARQRHGDLPPSCWHLGGGWRRGRRGPSLPPPLVRGSARLAHRARSRSEERRVGKECRYGWSPQDEKKKRIGEKGAVGETELMKEIKDG